MFKWFCAEPRQSEQREASDNSGVASYNELQHKVHAYLFWDLRFTWGWRLRFYGSWDRVIRQIVNQRFERACCLHFQNLLWRWKQQISSNHLQQLTRLFGIIWHKNTIYRLRILKGIGWVAVNWIHLACENGQWQTFVKKAMSLRAS
jgi:hypothetical protein